MLKTRTIFAVFLEDEQTQKNPRKVKRYAYNINADVKKGDVLELHHGSKQIRIVEVLDASFKYYNESTGSLSNEITSTRDYTLVEIVISDESPNVSYASKVASK